MHRACLWIVAALLASNVVAREPCRITIRDQATQWPVPLVELRTTDQRRWVSDNAGVIAFDLEEAMGQPTWFSVRGHGYGVPPDGFGYEGVLLTPQPGGDLTVTVHRRILARRIGRLTGAGRFSESAKLGDPVPHDPTPNLLGCDSIQTAVHDGRLYWFWGDTTVRKYRLGIFHATGARSAVAPLARLEPPLQLALDYVADERGLPSAVAPMPGNGPTWLTGVVSLPDQHGQSRLVASYMKVEPPLTVYEWGLAVWDKSSQQFVRERVLWTKSEESPQPPPIPQGHAVFWDDGADKHWVLFGDPLPKLQCPANYESWRDPQHWRIVTPPESLGSFADQRAVRPHSGAIAWNQFRKRWVTIFMEQFGKPSAFGELWYAEARQPFGPWGKTIKVLTHDNYSFYNPTLHPQFVTGDSALLFFEGTYSATFTDHAEPTPGYDYNQILYRLDLDDPALSGVQLDEP